MGGSSCRYCGPRLRALLDGELVEVEAVRVREHLIDCDACQNSLATAAEVSRLVGEIPAAIELALAAPVDIPPQAAVAE